METIRRSDKIYAWANEYHVMGLGTFKRGWCLMELGVTKAPPIIHSQHNGLFSDDNVDVRMNFRGYRKAESEIRAALQEKLRYEKAGFSAEDDRAIVRGFIESAHGDVARFEAFLVLKVLELKEQLKGWGESNWKVQEGGRWRNDRSFEYSRALEYSRKMAWVGRLSAWLLASRKGG